MVTNLNIKSNECKGCNQDYKCDLPYRYLYNNTLYICPCQSCLVKAICKEDCEEYMSYIQTFYKYKNQESNQNALIKEYQLENEQPVSLKISYKLHHYNRSIPIMTRFNDEDKKWELIPFFLQEIQCNPLIDFSYRVCDIKITETT